MSIKNENNLKRKERGSTGWPTNTVTIMTPKSISSKENSRGEAEQERFEYIYFTVSLVSIEIVYFWGMVTH